MAAREVSPPCGPMWMPRSCGSSAMPLSLLLRYGGTWMRERTSVTPAPPAPDHKAWMSQPCRCYDVAVAFTSYPRSRTGRRIGLTSHRNVLGTQQHQGPQSWSAP